MDRNPPPPRPQQDVGIDVFVDTADELKRSVDGADKRIHGFAHRLYSVVESRRLFAADIIAALSDRKGQHRGGIEIVEQHVEYRVEVLDVCAVPA